MAITWTIIVLGALLHGMASVETDPSQSNPTPIPSVAATSSITLTVSLQRTIAPSNSSTAGTSTDPTYTPAVTSTTNTIANAKITVTQQPTLADTSAAANTISLQTTQPQSSTANPVTTVTPVTPANSPAATKPTSLQTTQPQSSTANLVTTADPVTITKSPAATKPTLPQPSETQSNTTNPVNTTDPLTITKSPAATDTTIRPTATSTSGSTVKLFSTEAPSSSGHQTLESQTTIIPSTSVPSTSTPKTYIHPPFDLSSSSQGNILSETCKTLGQKMKGICSVNVTIQDKKLIATVTIDADQVIFPEHYKPLEKKEEISKATIPDTLIAILASCGALVLILCCFAAYCTYHRRSYRKNQQHLTEELQTVENGYHDNPTLEVMEVQPEMQEKKQTLNGEFNDSWIVPIDNLLKDDIPDEEDTHL